MIVTTSEFLPWKTFGYKDKEEFSDIVKKIMAMADSIFDLPEKHKSTIREFFLQGRITCQNAKKILEIKDSSGRISCLTLNGLKVIEAGLYTPEEVAKGSFFFENELKEYRGPWISFIGEGEIDKVLYSIKSGKITTDEVRKKGMEKYIYNSSKN